MHGFYDAVYSGGDFSSLGKEVSLLAMLLCHKFLFALYWGFLDAMDATMPCLGLAMHQTRLPTSYTILDNTSTLNWSAICHDPLRSTSFHVRLVL